MDEERWTEVDGYLSGLLAPADEVLEAALQASEAAGLPAIQVAPNQGKLLHLLVRVTGARRVLEIGTLGGYSAIWLARALLDGGSLVTLEAEPRHAEVARANLDRAGLAEVVEVRLGPALETLPRLDEEGHDLFDLTFIDADKENGAEYFRWALRLSRPGALIVVDNVVRGGAVADEASTDSAVVGTRRLLEAVAAEPRVTATAIQTVGVKGYDGLLVALVVA